MKNFFLKNNFFHLNLALFSVFTIWWVIIHPFNLDVLDVQKEHWSTLYWIFAVFAGCTGMIVSKRFGFTKSIIGKAIVSFSVGLLLQALGQIVDSYYSILVGKEIVYPSIAEIGYTGSIFAYIYGSYLLARYVVVSTCFKSLIKNLIVWLTPVAMFGFSYFSYLQNYNFEEIRLVQIIFDFGYPILQSIYVALAIFVLFRSHCIQGGVLRRPISFLVTALIIQYLADSYFVYEFNRGVWYSANLNDYLYLVGYFVLVTAIIYIDDVVQNAVQKNSAEMQNVISTDETKELYGVYVSLLQTIIKSQEEVIGPLAWTEVGQVPNIVIKDKENIQLEILGDPKKTIDSLLENFFNVFGPTALYVAKNSTYRLTKNMQTHQVPDKLL